MVGFAQMVGKVLEQTSSWLQWWCCLVFCRDPFSSGPGWVCSALTLSPERAQIGQHERRLALCMSSGFSWEIRRNSTPVIKPNDTWKLRTWILFPFLIVMVFRYIRGHWWACRAGCYCAITFPAWKSREFAGLNLGFESHFCLVSMLLLANHHSSDPQIPHM